MKRRPIIFLILLLIISPLLMAQQDEMMRDIMMSRKAERDRIIENAYSETEKGNYLVADSLYREIFSSIERIPSNLCYYFGKNSYYLDRHLQSLDWLNKYIELKGTSGAYFTDAKRYIEWNKSALRAQRSIKGKSDSTSASIRSNDFTIDCGPSGMVTCPVCQGETVIIKKDPLGDKYTTCTFCNKNGLMTCEDYNKLLRGELKPEQ